MQPARDINVRELQAYVEDAFAIKITAMQLSPVGEDAYGYFVDSEQRFYLKVYRRALNWRAVLDVPLELNKHGLWNAVAALPAQNGDLVLPFGRYWLALYPAIDGKTAIDQPLTLEQLREMGRILARLHAVGDQLNLPLERENFMFSLREVYVRVLDALPTALNHPDAYARQAAQILDKLKDRLAQELHDYDRAADQARSQGAPFVLCHHDPSIGNIITAEDGERLYLIDWDGVLLAPKERDLGHFHGVQRPLVVQGYAEIAGDVTLNDAVLEYYRLEWNIQEIADYGGRLFFEHDDHDDAQKIHDVGELKQALRDANMDF